VTGGDYANEISGLTIPLARFARVVWERKERTAEPTALRIHIPTPRSYGVNAPDGGTSDNRIIQSIVDTYTLYGVYTKPDGDEVKRAISEAIWRQPARFVLTDLYANEDTEFDAEAEFSITAANIRTSTDPNWFDDYWEFETTIPFTVAPIRP